MTPLPHRCPIGETCPLSAELATVIAERDKLSAAMERLRDCDWIITPHDRMDAVRNIAREALAAIK